MSRQLRFLIVDGYPLKSREQFRTVGMKLAGELYRDILLKQIPDAEYHLWYSSDPGVAAPTNEEVEAYDGVLWPGCNLTVYHDDPRVHAHLDLARRCFELGTPGFGSCWAIQVSTSVAGGKTEAHPKGREMGIATKIRLTEAGKNHPMMEGKPEVYSHFVSHDDHVVELPEGATLLAGNDWSPIQAVEVKYKKGVFWAVQYHPEYNLHEMARLILAREERLLKQGWFRDREDMLQYSGNLEAVHQDPSLKYLRWQLKIDDDIVEDTLRECEFINWLKHVVVPGAK